jgi:hypothetical protein
MTNRVTLATTNIQIGTRAIWVNASTGECLGRFGLMGIDVHRRIEDQGQGECLNCTHGKTTRADWARFQRSMLKFHGVDLSHVPAPRWVS